MSATTKRPKYDVHQFAHKLFQQLREAKAFAAKLEAEMQLLRQQLLASGRARQAMTDDLVVAFRLAPRQVISVYYRFGFFDYHANDHHTDMPIDAGCFDTDHAYWVFMPAINCAFNADSGILYRFGDRMAYQMAFNPAVALAITAHEALAS